VELANKAPHIFESSEPDKKRQLIKLVLQNPVINDTTLTATIRSPFSRWAERASRHKWLPMYGCCKNFFYDFELEGVRRIRQYKRKPRKPKIYVNPVTQAMDYKRMMKEGNLTQIELARDLGISRVRVTPIALI